MGTVPVCTECGRKNIKVRFNWSAWKHNNPHTGATCFGPDPVEILAWHMRTENLLITFAPVNN
ncbi:hypothetical protein D1O33_00510 [Rhodococcus rhodochrous]|nr:hypothetical protein D1O33_00510 [Rhodococcus rhodochrous]